MLSPQTPKPGRARSVRIAFICDVHLQPERGAAEGLADCLDQIHALSDPPALIVNGGDAVMDTVSADATRAGLLWDLWQKVVSENCTLPMEHCLGNHDLWGCNRRRSGCTGKELLYGAGFAMDRLGLECRFHAVEVGGWRILCLDSNFVDETGHFVARLDEPQWEWLKDQIAMSDRPLMVVSHVPILAGASVFLTGSEGETERTGNWVVPAQWMHIDARRICRLFSSSSSVRLCLSGHTHMRDHLEFQDVTYLSLGAVSGMWWRGDYMGTPAGFTLIDLYDDGTFAYTYVPTRWRPRPSRGTFAPAILL